MILAAFFHMGRPSRSLQYWMRPCYRPRHILRGDFIGSKLLLQHLNHPGPLSSNTGKTVDIAFLFSGVDFVSLTGRAHGQHSSAALQLKSSQGTCRSPFYKAEVLPVRFYHGCHRCLDFPSCWAVENVQLASTRSHSLEKAKMSKWLIWSCTPKMFLRCGAETLHAGQWCWPGLGAEVWQLDFLCTQGNNVQSTNLFLVQRIFDPSTMPKIVL